MESNDVERTLKLKLKNGREITLTILEQKLGFLLCYNVTDLIGHLFGTEILKKAEIAVWCTNNDLENAERISRYFSEVLEQEGKQEFSFNRENLLLTFTNGKQLTIWNSEWGGIRAGFE